MRGENEKRILDYLKKCISEENNIIRESKRELEDRIGKVLFGEGGMSVERAEKLLFPFEQSGYLNAEEKLDLLLYQEEKREGADRTLLDEWIKKNIAVITEKEISEVYIKRRKDRDFFFSWEEKKEFLIHHLSNQFGMGVVGILLRLGGDAIAIGECCSCCEKAERRLEVRKGERILTFPCLEFSSEEEMEFIIRRIIEREKKGEMTRKYPVWKSERCDGTQLVATRPPATAHWGLEIVIGNAEGKSLYG